MGMLWGEIFLLLMLTMFVDDDASQLAWETIPFTIYLFWVSIMSPNFHPVSSLVVAVATPSVRKGP